MKLAYRSLIRGIAIFFLAASAATAQTTYQPKFPGDPARSESEAAALGYMRTVLRAQKLYEKKNGHYAKSLMQLVHTGSFTRRMANTEQGDYTAGFRAQKDGFVLTMTPNQVDPQHRSFYAEEDAKIHAEEDKAAGPDSPVVGKA